MRKRRSRGPFLCDHLGEDVEQFRVGAVADGVDGDRQPGLVRCQDVLAQLAQRRHEDAGAARLVADTARTSSPCWSRASRRRSPSGRRCCTQSSPKLGLDAQRRPSCCHSASGQRRSMRAVSWPGAGQLLIEPEQPAARARAAAVHVLHAGDAVAARSRPGRRERPRRFRPRMAAGTSRATRPIALSRSRPLGSFVPGLR